MFVNGLFFSRVCVLMQITTLPSHRIIHHSASSVHQYTYCSSRRRERETESAFNFEENENQKSAKTKQKKTELKLPKKFKINTK